MTAPTDNERQDSFVVGIGASAGGLEAISTLLHRVNLDGAAFLVVQHLAPTHKSMLPELLSRVTRIPVVAMDDGMRIEPSRIYVAPPNVEVTAQSGVLRLAPAHASNRAQLPIDTMFRSLADDFGHRAIGVVLSGTGTDGTFGLQAIKAAGGITFAQDPATAKFDGMPRSALDSGAADFRLSAEEIGDEIVRVAAHPYLHNLGTGPRIDEEMAKLSALIKNAYSFDLGDYKVSTIERRLQRRMALHRIDRFSDYVRMCQSDERELTTLHRDLLINVTSFFRDREPWELLEKSLLGHLLENRRDGAPLRVWVPGCASGEEAYTLAICITEFLDKSDRMLKVQIFGTDIDAEAIHQARRGIYPANIAADVSPERLRQFFTRTEDGQFQIARRIRDMVVFSVQNLSRDAPFSKLDIVSCRNLLIYLQPVVQQKVMRILHYALHPGALLILGTSESVGDSSDLFTLVDRKNKIYTSKHMALAPVPLDLGVGIPMSHAKHETASPTTVRPMVSIAHLADRKILEQYAPPGVVVNESLDILYFRGRTTPYLEQPSGVATHSILRLVRQELHAPLRKAIDHVLATGEPSSVDGQIRDAQMQLKPVKLVVQPLLEPETRARCLLILFKDATPAAASPVVDAVGESPAAAEHARLLQQELTLTKDYLQSTIEELERSNEDLKSANEELQSSNEELQSTNEELETSKEELQSTNEELITLNEELQNRMRDLSTANDDLHNLLANVDRPIVIVGLDHRIRRFTQAAERLFNLVAADLGREATQLDAFLRVPVEPLIAEVIEAVTTVEREVAASDGRWYMLRITPYKTLDLAIRGAVMVVHDITLEKRRAELTILVNDYALEFLAAIGNPLLIVNSELAVIWVNEKFYAHSHASRDEIIGGRLGEILGGQYGAPLLIEKVKRAFTSGVPFRAVQMELPIGGGAPRTAQVSGSRIRVGNEESPLVMISLESGAGDLPI